MRGRVPNLESHVSLAHLMWAVPAATLSAVIAVGIGLLGFCAGQNGGCGRTEAVGAEVALRMFWMVIAGLAFAVWIALAPWNRNARARLAIAALCGVGVALSGLIYMITKASSALV
jgi:hypothetical protein